MKYSRRGFGMLLPAVAAAQRESLPTLPSKAFKFEDLPVRTNRENQFRPVMRGATHTGFPIEVHETDLAAGGQLHPAHKHLAEEMFLIRQGSLDVTVNGETTRLAAGSVFYVNSNDLHGLHNPGPDRTRYFVIALGPA
jgi:quercetin dioxygenase-like cupin family protein